MTELFDPNLFVGREDILNKVEKWANEDKSPHRLLSIVGSPGIGKSWLMGKAKERLDGQKRLVFWANLSQDARDPTSGKPAPDLITEAGQQEWLEHHIIQKTRQLCPGAKGLRIGSIEAALDSLVNDLCGPCQPMPPPVLLVDGFEEVADDQRERLEERIFKRFLFRDCTRMIVSRRDEFSLTNSVLRWNERKEQIGVLQSLQGQEQLRRRADKDRTTLDLNTLIRSIPPYKWNHPHINTFLFERIKQRQPSTLNATDLRECIDEVIRPTMLEPAAFGLLDGLAHLRLSPQAPPVDDWTEKNLRDSELQIGLEDKDLSRLFDAGLVHQKKGTQRYMVGDGLRELLRARNNMIASQNQPGGEK